MDVGDGLLEIEIRVHLGGSDAHVAAGREAPIGGGDILPRDDFGQTGHGLNLRLWEAILQPDDVAVEIRYMLELLHSGAALFVELFDELARASAVINLGDRFDRREFGRYGDSAQRELVEQVHLLDEALSPLGDRVKGFAGRVLLIVRGGQAFAGLLLEGRQVGDQRLGVGVTGFPRVAEFGQRLGESLSFLRVQVRQSLHGPGEDGEPCVEGRECGFEGGDFLRHGGALCGVAFEIILHEREKAVALASVEPDDGGEVAHLLRRELMDLARAFHELADAAGVEHQDLIFAAGGFVAVEMPQLARNSAGVEEAAFDGDHHVHVAGLDELLADGLFVVAAAGGLGGHNEAGAARGGEVAPEVGNPEVISARDALVLVHAGQAEGQARIVLDALRIDEVHVEGWIGHDEVALARKGVLVLVVGDGLGDFPLQPVDGEVHLGDADGVAVLLLPVEDDLLRGIAALLLDEVAGLDKHAARSAGWIKHDTVVRLDDVDDELHERGGREELAIVMRLLDGELGEEVFVDAPEDVAGGALDLLAIEEAHQFLKHLWLEDAVVLREDVRQRFEIRFDGGHRIGDELGQAGGVRRGLGHDDIIASGLGQEERTAADVIGGLHFAFGHPARGLIVSDLLCSRVEAIGGVTQKDDAQHGHEIVAGRELGIGAEIVCGFPEVGFKFGEIVHQYRPNWIAILAQY